VNVDIISLFPGFFESPLKTSILGRALDRNLINVNCVDLRVFGEGARKKVDDKPYGGGPGMLMMPGPLASAIESVRKDTSHIIYMSPQGKPLKSADCEKLATYEHLIIICGHYEGIDQRIIENYVDQEICIGDFIMTSGMPAAVCLVDAIARFIPQVLGDEMSNQTETFKEGKFEGPQYTKPVDFNGALVPDVLLNGNHQKIAAWRASKALEKMGKIRPDLID
jgi:tRNA (guanine37-N1)-methyltransferase